MSDPRPQDRPTSLPAAAPSAAPPDDWPAVPGHEILAELGRGGMGVVYKARQLGANRLVALKMILGGGHAGAAARRRFLAEVEAAARLRHPGIVQVYEVGEHAGLPYYSMEFCPRGSLDDLAAGRPMDPAAAAAVVERLARAVEAAHLAGVVHRDLKPANVLLGDDGTPKVADFGLAKRLDAGDGLTASGAMMGTPQYMAPEQAGGKARHVGPGADVYALGAILYELLTGVPPFDGDSLPELIRRVLDDPPVPVSVLRPGVPRDLEVICLKCLEKEPGKRYPTAGAVAEDLRRFQAGESITARAQNLVDRVAGVLERSRYDDRFAPFAGMIVGLGLIQLVAEGVVSASLWAELPAGWAAATYPGRVLAAAVLIVLSTRGRPGPVTPVDQHVAGVWGGFALASALITLGGAGPATGPAAYQAFAAAAAVGCFAMGALFWGGGYLAGGAFLVLIPLAPVEPRLTPLLYGLVWAGTLAGAARRLRRAGRAVAP